MDNEIIIDMKRNLLFVLFLLSIMVSCRSVFLYENGEKRPVHSIIHRRNFFYEKTIHENEQTYRLFSKGLVRKYVTYLLFDDSTFSTYNNPALLDGKWRMKGDSLFLTTVVIWDSISSAEAFYSKSNDSDSTLIFIYFNGFRGRHFLEGIRIYYSEKDSCYYHYLNPHILKVPNNIHSIKLDYFGKGLKRMKVMAADTLLLKVNILPKRTISKDTIIVSNITSIKKSNVTWYIADKVKVKEKIIDGAKILVSDDKKSIRLLR